MGQGCPADNKMMPFPPRQMATTIKLQYYTASPLMDAAST